MKLTKKLEAEITSVYETYWKALLIADIDTYTSVLDEKFKLIGTTESEVFFKSIEAIQFLETTAGQVAGNIELRNRVIKIELIETLILVTEQSDTYVKIDGDWNFYGKARISSLIGKKKQEWKFIQMHLSFPDSKAEEGQTIGLDKIAKENLELRDAIKRRTIELENKNRELELEASLEKVRTVALSMRKPDDMLEVCLVISNQLKQLNLKEIRNVQTAIIYEAKGFYMNYEYYAKHDKSLITEVNFSNHPLQYEFVFQMLKGPEEFFEKSFKGLEIKKWYDYQKTTNQFADSYLETAPSLNYYFYSMGNVALGMSTYTALSAEEIVLFKRFRNVFDLAYQRYADIEQAESQAREAQIQLALERVRARTMAMQNSEELTEVSYLLNKQVVELGIPTRGCAFNIYNEHDSSEWFSNLEGTIPVYKTPRENIFLKYYEAGQRGEMLLIEEFGGERIKAHYQYLATLSVADNSEETIEKNVIAVPEYQIDHAAYFKYGYLLFITLRPAPEAHEVFKRFAKEFEQTYIRFLDLQKAEAQARESQIELSLERVRAKAMAMSKSNELKDAAFILYRELRSLGILEFINCGFVLIDEPKNVQQAWMTYVDGTIREGHHLPLTGDSIMNERYETWKSKKPVSYQKVGGKELKKHLQFVSEINEAAIKTKIIDLPDPTYFYCGNFSEGYLHLVTAAPISEEGEAILTRFTNVFDLTYTRFLDLQKAEAQARESQIELSLERVRAKAMAMHSSEDLALTVDAFFSELNALHVTPRRCGVTLINADSRIANLTVTTATQNGETKKITGELKLSGHPVLDLVYNNWKLQQEYHPILQGAEIKRYYQVMNPQVSYPDFAEDEKQFGHYFFFKEGGVFAWTDKDLTEEELQIFRKFTSVLSLTYRRYMDLAEAELQTKEAQVEAALERVRSRTLAMQKSEELAETAAVLFQQLIKLGIAPNRLYIGIIKDDSGDIEAWATDEAGGKINSRFTLSRKKNSSVQKMYDGWKARKKSITIDMQGKELADYLQYLSGEIGVSVTVGLSQQRRVQNVAYFGKGFIGIASPDHQPEETIQLIERFTAVFNLTYTRFNDLKIAEAHGLQAEEDLIKLQIEKKRAEDALSELKATQTQLIQSEKMASLGELTAGIAHEIQNPLNFVNNFSEVSAEMIEEMKEEIAKGDLNEAIAISNDLKQNLEKINLHGNRASSIVKGMLEHSRTSSGKKELTDINALADEYLKLTYHGLRAKDKSFNAEMKTDFEESLPKIAIVPQDFGRVLLNLINNAFYAVNEKQKAESYKPTVTISTKSINGKVEITISDNGDGIPQNIIDKIFQPFFTTKPTGKGTGLGLSLAYDIVKAHGGELKVDSIEGEGLPARQTGTKFIIELPIEKNA